MTARDQARGEAAVQKLKEEGFKVKFHQLDVTDQTSVQKFKEFIQATHGGIDILVNNAGIAYNVSFFFNNLNNWVFIAIFYAFGFLCNLSFFFFKIYF